MRGLNDNSRANRCEVSCAVEFFSSYIKGPLVDISIIIGTPDPCDDRITGEDSIDIITNQLCGSRWLKRGRFYKSRGENERDETGEMECT